MRLLKKIIIGLSLIAMTGCVGEPGQVSDVHTGVSASHSKMYDAASGLLFNLNVVTLVGKRNGETRYALGTHYRATGIGWANFEKVWSFGTELPFEVQGRDVGSCGGGSCSIVERGIIRLTKQQFVQASKTGLEFKLVGSNRSLIGKVPAQAFKEALILAP